MKIAAIDLGSNTSLLLIAEINKQRIDKVIVDLATVTKMGQGVHANRRFHPEALQRLDECFTKYSKVIVEHGCDKVIAVATSAARDVANGSELLQLGQKYAIPIHIIPGETEAELTYRGALFDRAETSQLAVIDVGGGSTEIISNDGGTIEARSVDVGSVRLTELFVESQPISDEVLMKIMNHAQHAFSAVVVPKELKEVVAVAGTPTTLAALEQKMEFCEERVHGFCLKLSVIEKWIDVLSPMTVEQRERLPGMQPKRADVIVTGAILLAAAMRRLGKSEVTVSTKGVRYGVALRWQDF